MEWVDLFAETVRCTMRTCRAKVNSCIEATLVGVGVAQACGYLAEPVPVCALVHAGKQATVLPGPPGSPRQRGEGYEGHLLLHFPAANITSDITADQFHDPRRGLLVPRSVVFPATRAELVAGVEHGTGNGTRIIYAERVGDISYRAYPAWALPSPFTTAVALRNLRAAWALAGGQPSRLKGGGTNPCRTSPPRP